MKAVSEQGQFDNRFMYYFLANIIEIGNATIEKLDDNISVLSDLLYMEEIDIRSFDFLDNNQVEAIIRMRELVEEIFSSLAFPFATGRAPFQRIGRKILHVALEVSGNIKILRRRKCSAEDQY